MNKIKEARKLDKFIKEYHIEGIKDDYIAYLKSLVIEKNIPVEKIIESMPMPDLIKKDRTILHDISYRFKCYLLCIPISYLLTESLAKQEDIKKKYNKELTYEINIFDKQIKAPFTLEEFIESVNQKKLIKKR